MGKVGKVQGPRVQGPQAPNKKIKNNVLVTIHNYLYCMGVLCTWKKRLEIVEKGGRKKGNDVKGWGRKIRGREGWEGSGRGER